MQADSSLVYSQGNPRHLPKWHHVAGLGWVLHEEQGKENHLTLPSPNKGFALENNMKNLIKAETAHYMPQ